MNQGKKKLREMQQKWWWSYALLGVGIFLFTQGSSILNENIQYALPVIIFSLFMHNASMNDLGKRFFKTNVNALANHAMILALAIIAITSYFLEINIIYILILNVVAIALNLFISAISFKFLNKK